MNTCYCDKPTLYLRKQGLNSRAFVKLWVFFHFFCRLTDEYSWCFKHDSNKKDSYSNEQNRCSVFLTTKFRVQVKIQNAPKKLLFRDFVCRIYVKGCLGWKIFPPKNLGKNTAPKIRMRQIFFLYYSSNIFQIKSKMVMKNICLLVFLY